MFNDSSASCLINCFLFLKHCYDKHLFLVFNSKVALCHRNGRKVLKTILLFICMQRKSGTVFASSLNYIFSSVGGGLGGTRIGGPDENIKHSGRVENTERYE